MHGKKMPTKTTRPIQIFNTLVNLKKGTEILINGASGGIGMFATQIAKMKGAIVTAVVGDSGIQTVQDWGADFIVNYRTEDVLKGINNLMLLLTYRVKCLLVKQNKL